jgi:alkaline phosphatase
LCRPLFLAKQTKQVLVCFVFSCNFGFLYPRTIRMKFLLLVAFFAFACCPLRLLAQTNRYTVANAHSHNDYSQDTAFYKAFRHGFGSIEADIFSVNNDLFVAHDRDDIRAGRSLKTLYLDPLHAALSRDPNRSVQLLVDVKGSPDTILPLLVTQLQPLKPFYKSGRLTILISGNRPLPADYSRYPDMLWFDDDLVLPHSKKEWERVGLVSLRYSLFSTWKGQDTIPAKDEDRLRRIINSVHAAGKGIRFWDAPDTVSGWKSLLKLGVDFIGTDHIDALSRFLAEGSRKAL